MITIPLYKIIMKWLKSFILSYQLWLQKDYIPYLLLSTHCKVITVCYPLLSARNITWLQHHILSYQLCFHNYPRTMSSVIYKIIIKWLKSNYDYKIIIKPYHLLSTLIDKNNYIPYLLLHIIIIKWLPYHILYVT